MNRPSDAGWLAASEIMGLYYEEWRGEEEYCLAGGSGGRCRVPSGMSRPV
jgi:hypothetical protein